jgi:cellulose synthase/poly-beta-1,6-N-acetylglucosamine synthase-like glycosyltransferase
MNSVVICAYTIDRWVQIVAAVSSVECQATVGEVIVVVDHNAELLDRCQVQWPQHRVVANGQRRGLSGARNTGIGASSGDVVAFLDDDAVAASDWMERLAETFDDPTVGGVGGYVRPAWAGTCPAWFPPEFLWVVGCSYIGQPTVVAEIRNPIGANMAFRRSVFNDVGGFREGIGRVGTLPLGCEETELSIRARAAGYTIWFQADAIVDHLVPASRSTAQYFLTRCVAEGRSKAVVSAMVGPQQGLQSERAYVSRTLPAGVKRSLGAALAGPQRAGALGRSLAIVAGLLATAIGFVHGALRRAHRTTSPTVPLITLSPTVGE